MITISAFLPCVRVKGCLEGHARTRVNVKVEPLSTFTFTHGLPPLPPPPPPFILCLFFIYVRSHGKVSRRQWKSTLKQSSLTVRVYSYWRYQTKAFDRSKHNLFVLFGKVVEY